MLKELPSQPLVKLIIIILLAYHMREAERLEAIIQNCGAKNRWHELWPKFQEASENDEEALLHFTQFIMAQLDGGDFTLPSELSLE